MEFPINGLRQHKQRRKSPSRAVFFRAVWCASAICGLLAIRASAQISDDCSVYRPETALASLKHDRGTLTPECIRRAIEVLRQYEHRPAIDVLFKYLDFTPFPPGVPPSADASEPTNRVYPAADALCSFGKAILPRVKKVIRNDDETALARCNAARIYFALVRGPESIRFIMQAAREASDPHATTKLVQFAEDAVPYCPEEQRAECKHAISQ
jgi:hypothetical protein